MLNERLLSGPSYLDAVTALLQRIRAAHPTAGLKEAADLQWSWRNQRATDNLPQLFWFDDERPEAAMIATGSDQEISLDLMVLPEATPEWVAHVVDRGVSHLSEAGFESIELEIDSGDDLLRERFRSHGFELEENGVVEAWLAADQRPEISPLADGYRLSSRLLTMDRPHHMISVERGHGDPEPRLRETSLYRPDLDLAVFDRDGDVAAYGLFWYDPESATGVVEPMRTETDHQQRGLARHVITTGIGLLAEAGADRIKLVYGPDNQAASSLYLGVGFEPDRRTDIFKRSATPQTAPAT